jgi:ribonuclease HII
MRSAGEQSVLKDAGYSVKSERKKTEAVTGKLYDFDRDCRTHTGMVIVGVDEAGRGPLAGPVVAAAVILDPATPIEGINDSKKLSALQRDRLYGEITALAREWAIGSADPEEIDRINILQATFVAMHRAIENLSTRWEKVVIDGNQKIKCIPDNLQQTVVRGDGLSASIAAASIVAKVTRDRLMQEYHATFPYYGFDVHKGYGTALHRNRIQQYGLCSLHRKSFCSSLILQTTLEF